MSGSNRIIVAMVAVAGLMAAFWILALSPKREEASDLAVTVTELETTLAQHQQEVSEALAARDGFPDDYRQLVVLGKAVPGEDDTASLLVEFQRIADDAHVRFREFELSDSGSGEAPPAAPATESAPPTEVAASLLPLGATIGPAGLGVMPYTLTFTGNFSRVSDFIAGLDRLVKTKNEELSVTGRLITVDGFSLTSSQGHPFPQLEATFSVTTFLTPPGQGLTAGANSAVPLTSGTPASLTTEGTP